MIPAPELPDESRRLDALRALHLLDTPAEERFDHITRIAQHIFKVPMTVISLVDKDRQWFKSRQGLEATETPRDISFCGHAIQNADTMVVSDASADARFADNPLVTGDPHIRFYAGRPLATPDGNRVGTLCLMDRQPRPFSESDNAVLADLAKMVEHELTALTLAEACRKLEEATRALSSANENLEKRVEERTYKLSQANLELTREIEERERLKTVLKDSDARFRTIFEQSPMGMDLVDLRDWRFVQVNEAFCQMLGYAHEELYSMTVRDVMPAEDLQVNLGEVQALLAGKRTNYQAEIRNIRKNGEILWVRVFVTLLRNAQGEPRYFLAIVEDIRERKRAEAALIQAEKMAGIGQFAATLAHDLNNPIGVIMGFTQILIDEALSRQEMEKPLRSIEREALRCKNLVENLLSFSRRRPETAMKAQDLRTVLDNALALVTTLAHSRRINVVRLPDETLPPVMADGMLLQQAIINLCTNALDAMSDGGRLTVGVAAGPHGAKITVQDTGTGIPAEIRAHMFEPFFTTKEVGKGTGLGLSIISDIVKKHHGTIEVQSEMGRGTLFVLHLPLDGPGSVHQEMKGNGLLEGR